MKDCDPCGALLYYLAGERVSVSGHTVLHGRDVTIYVREFVLNGGVVTDDSVVELVDFICYLVAKENNK